MQKHFYGFTHVTAAGRVISVALEDVVAVAGDVDPERQNDGTVIYLAGGVSLHVRESLKAVKDALKSYDLVAPFE